MEGLTYIKAAPSDADAVTKLVQNTITAIYPNYYPKEVVRFFCSLHNREKILEDIEKNSVFILLKEHQLTGTGSCEGNHITRVYVSPNAQGLGYGGFIMQKLEEAIAREHSSVFLDASLPACSFYEKRGYRTLKHNQHHMENNAVLVYEIMQKDLRQHKSSST